jgi:hypothetical protein
MTPTEMFYEDGLFLQEIDFTELSNGETQAPLQREKFSIAAPIMAAISAVTVVGLLSIGQAVPSSWTSPNPDIIEQMLGRKVPDVAVPTAHVQAATRFGKLFRAVPRSDVEKLPDPDYDL